MPRAIVGCVSSLCSVLSASTFGKGYITEAKSWSKWLSVNNNEYTLQHILNLASISLLHFFLYSTYYI
jgi:hypothetical protein